MSYVRPFTVRGGTGSGTHPSPCWTSRGTRSSAPDRMKTSDSSASLYCGRPLSVLRVIEASDRLHPKPNGPLPEPESYESVSSGPNRDRAGLVAIDTVIEPDPVTGLAANFSPMPRMAPPPLGRETAGTVGRGWPSGGLDTRSCDAMRGRPRDRPARAHIDRFRQPFTERIGDRCAGGMPRWRRSGSRPVTAVPLNMRFR